MKGNAYWINRRSDFDKICKIRDYKLVTSGEDWILGSKKFGYRFKPKMICPKGHLVDNTFISNFVNKKRGCCSCGGSEPWKHRRPEFKEKCDSKNYTLLTSEQNWKNVDIKIGKNFKPKMRCPNNHLVT